MNINPFRLTAGAYLLSKDMRDKKRERDRERKGREKQERFFILKKRENRAIVWMSFSLTAEISIRYNDINLFFFSHPSSWSPQRMQKRSSSTFYLSLYRYAPLKIALEKTKNRMDTKTDEKAEFINHGGFIGFHSKICLGLEAI